MSKVIVFSQSTDTTPQPSSWNGMSVFWTVPRAWAARAVPGAENNIQVSPNSDFSPPVYDAWLDQDLTLKFQTVLPNRLIGTDNGNQS